MVDDEIEIAHRDGRQPRHSSRPSTRPRKSSSRSADPRSSASSAVDLRLLLEGAIYDVAGLLLRWNVPGGIIRRDWQVWLKPGIEGGRILRRIERLWKCCVRRSVLLHLPDSLTRIGDAIHARKPAVQTVEAPILLIDHDDVLDFLKASRLGDDTGARQGDRDCTQNGSCEA